MLEPIHCDRLLAASDLNYEMPEAGLDDSTLTAVKLARTGKQKRIFTKIFIKTL
jgi:hypothetical protein